DVIDLTRCVSGATYFDLDVGRTDDDGLTLSLAACAANRNFTLHLGFDGRIAREIERCRHPGEDVVARADLPGLSCRLDAAGAAPGHEHRLHAVTLTGERSGEALEGEIAPAGGVRRDAVPLPRLQQQPGHTRAPRSSSSVGIASEHATRLATIAPAVFPSRTPSPKPSPCTIAHPSPAANASPPPS